MKERTIAPAPTETMLTVLALAPLFEPPLAGAVELELGALRTVADDIPDDVVDDEAAVVDAEVEDGGADGGTDADVEVEPVDDVEDADPDVAESVTEADTLVAEPVLDGIEDAVCETVVTVMLVPSVPVPLGSAGFSMVKN